ncbi:MAG: hypothetical protein HUU08_13450 [Candidatus Brocadia sp.]|nr:hypothetical protein [Candidatus Brocadia sp.]
MKIAFRETFAKDLKNVKDKGLLKRVTEIIEAVGKKLDFANRSVGMCFLKNWPRQRVGKKLDFANRSVAAPCQAYSRIKVTPDAFPV